MEQARFWMWAKTKPDPAPAAAAMAPYGDSWEEQAFAEDAAGTLGGCVWPPRSYSCTFCRREFKSAQALGGHMNVHRRDRARLKQSSNDHHLLVVPQTHPCTSYPSSKICTTFLYNNPNPNPNPNPNSNPPSWSSFLTEKRDRDVESKRRAVDPEPRAEKEDCVTELDVVSLVVKNDQTQTKAASDEEVASCKRRRIEAKPLPELSEVERLIDQSSEVVYKVCPVEELDLELRLGNAPKVK